MNHPKFIVVIGTSAGGFAALGELVSQLGKDMDAAFFIVMHLSRTAISDYLVQRLQPQTQLLCLVAKDAMPIEKGRIYVAPPNEHLIVIKDQIVVGHGPEENSWRPSIDVLFRSAAATYNSCVIGIILTGFLNDGTSGMEAIKRSGGICIVQDPNEAEVPDMSLSVLNNLQVDYTLGLGQMAKTLSEIFQSNPSAMTPPPDVVAEASIAERMVVGIDRAEDLGERSVYTCPDCGGGLWLVQDEGLNRFRCFTGHSYSENELLFRQGTNVEHSVWIAVRMMEERRNLYNKIAVEHQQRGLSRISTTYQQNAEDLKRHIYQQNAENLKRHIETLKQVLVSIHQTRNEK
jgi:two-component system, chemotaxis family, protein-glutamate methylesterase/glutaminase